MKILEFTNLSGESSAQLTEHIVSVIEERKLMDKVVSLSALVGLKQEERIMSLKGSEIK
jgi:hypothetical protein